MLAAGKLLVVMGLTITAIGIVLWLLGRSGFRGLPGDIVYESDHVRVYFPIVTMLMLSALLTAVFWIWRWLSGR